MPYTVTPESSPVTVRVIVSPMLYVDLSDTTDRLTPLAAVANATRTATTNKVRFMMTSLLFLSFASAPGQARLTRSNETCWNLKLDQLQPGVPAQLKPDGPGTAPPRRPLNFGTKYI